MLVSYTRAKAEMLGLRGDVFHFDLTDHGGLERLQTFIAQYGGLVWQTGLAIKIDKEIVDLLIASGYVREEPVGAARDARAHVPFVPGARERALPASAISSREGSE